MKTIAGLIQEAQAEGMLPAGATAPHQEDRPWPVILLTGIGAWFAALPLLGMVYMLLGDAIVKGAGAYAVGGMILLAAVVILRATDVSLFVEQLAVPSLLVGGGSIAVGLFRDLTIQNAAIVLALLACAIAGIVVRNWLRILLGAFACGMVVIACLPNDKNFHGNTMVYFWLGWHVSFGLWLLSHWLMAAKLNSGKTARAAIAIDAFSTGWILATLAGLASWSGMTFLIGASVGMGSGAHAEMLDAQRWSSLVRSGSVVMAFGAAAWLARQWPTLRQPWCAGAALIVAGLAWLMPSLGAVLLAIAVCASTKRLKMAAAGAVAATWIIGNFYYQLNFPLADKAFMLIGAGALLGVLAWTGAGKGLISAGINASVNASGHAGIAISALLVMLVANGGIWQKERLIANGTAVYVELAPVDPRSLMQGDFMRLNYRLPLNRDTRAQPLPGAQRPYVVASRDARGVATPIRMHDDRKLASNEFLIELTPHSGGWVLVSDAWFFREGEGQRWAAAKYGEFRVVPDGRALLVGLRGPNLEKL